MVHQLPITSLLLTMSSTFLSSLGITRHRPFSHEDVQRVTRPSVSISDPGRFNLGLNIELGAQEILEVAAKSNRNILTPDEIHMKTRCEDKEVMESSSASTASRTEPDAPKKEIACAWLLGWLLLENLLFCPVSGITPVANIIQIAQIMFPSTTQDGDPVVSRQKFFCPATHLSHFISQLLWHEYVLGMTIQSISVYSRLFLMPCKKHLLLFCDSQA